MGGNSCIKTTYTLTFDNVTLQILSENHISCEALGKYETLYWVKKIISFFDCMAYFDAVRDEN